MSKFDDLRKQNPQWDVTIFDLIKQSDPSDSNRYVSFLFKLLKNNVAKPEDFVRQVTGIGNEDLKKFHQWHTEGLIENKDILTYKTIKDFNDQLGLAEEKVRIREAERQVVKLYEDEEWVVMRPESYDACRVYGNGTRWCITQKKHWEDYIRHCYFIFIINKKDNQKYCVSKDTRAKIRYQCWHADDTEMNIIELPLPPELYSVIFKELKENNRPAGLPVGDELYWTKADGTIIKIEDMSASHLRNTLAKFRLYNNDGRIQAKLDTMLLMLASRETAEKALVRAAKATKGVEIMDSEANTDWMFGVDEESAGDATELPW